MRTWSNKYLHVLTRSAYFWMLTESSNCRTTGLTVRTLSLHFSRNFALSSSCFWAASDSITRTSNFKSNGYNKSKVTYIHGYDCCSIKQNTCTDFSVDYTTQAGQKYSPIICKDSLCETGVLLLLLHTFNGLFSRTAWVSQHQVKNQSGFKWGKRWWEFGMQCHQLDHMQTICTLIHADNHTNTWSLNFYWPDVLPDAQPTVSKHWKQWDRSSQKKVVK